MAMLPLVTAAVHIIVGNYRLLMHHSGHCSFSQGKRDILHAVFINKSEKIKAEKYNKNKKNKNKNNKNNENNNKNKNYPDR